MGFTLRVGGVFLSTVMLLVLPAQAQALPSMFNHDGVRDLFHDTLTEQAAPPIVLQRPKVEKKTQKLAGEEKAQMKSASAEGEFSLPGDQPTLAESNSEEQEQDFREQMVEKYGDPAERQPVRAKDDAPAPYKAMLEALDAGDRDLAMQYAVKYSRYLQDVQNVVNDSVTLTGMADVREGVLGPDSWPLTESFAKDRHYITDPLFEEEEEQKKEAEVRSEQVGEKMQALLKKAQASQHSLLNEGVNSLTVDKLKLNEAEERKRARLALRGKVPIQPGSNISIFFFFRPYDFKAQAIAADVERLHQEAKNDPNRQFAGLTIDSLNQGNITKFKRVTGCTFPVQDGSALSHSMKITNSPSFLIINDKGGAYIEEELRNYYFLDEAIRMMQGKK